MKTKKKIVCVSPKSKIARDRFIHMMNSFHSCVVENETETEYYLSSLNREYYFKVPKNENYHWIIHK
jgi:hypothetical protein